MVYLLLGLVFLACIWLMARAFVAADPRHLAVGVKWVGGAGLGALALLFLFRGNFEGMGAALGAILPLLIRWKRLWQILFPTRTAQPGGPASTSASSLSTAYLAVALDHATGRMTGDVTAGRLRGRRLEDLNATEAVGLMAEAQDDPATLQVLETFLDREHPGWRDTAGPAPPSRSGAMSRAEALQVLGLAEGAAADQIRDAHRRLMMANHPDRGGSTYLAAQINQAKDTLLGNS